MFTHTVGDPGRSERIAAAVLDDDAARAEVAAPIADSVMRSTGLPGDQRVAVEQQVDLVLQDPRGAQAFIDPFAGSWARMLGEDDPRPTQFDLAPLLADFQSVADAAAAANPGSTPFTVPATLPVGGVPLPRAQLGWMGGVRRGVDASVIPLALIAAALFGLGFAIGDRARTLRRLGAWGFGAGALWVIVPPVVVWAAGQWAPGADSVVAVALREATSGLRVAALALVAGGVAAYAASFTIAAGDRRVEAPAVRAAPVGTRPAPSRARAQPAPVVARTATMPVEVTREIPATPTGSARTAPRRASGGRRPRLDLGLLLVLTGDDRVERRVGDRRRSLSVTPPPSHRAEHRCATGRGDEVDDERDLVVAVLVLARHVLHDLARLEFREWAGWYAVRIERRGALDRERRRRPVFAQRRDVVGRGLGRPHDHDHDPRREGDPQEGQSAAPGRHQPGLYGAERAARAGPLGRRVVVRRVRRTSSHRR